MTAAHGRWSRLPAISASVSVSAMSYWPTSGCASRAADDPVAPAVPGGVERELLVRRDVGDQAGVQRLERASTGRGTRPDDRHVARHLDHGVVGEERQRPVVAHVGHVHAGVLRRRPAARRSGLDCRLGVVGAAALLEQLGLGVQRRVGVHLEQVVLDAQHLLGARARARAARAPPRRGRRSSAGSTTAPRRARRAATAAARAVRRASSPCCARRSGSTSRPSTTTRRIQVRWLSPTWSRRDLRRRPRRASRRRAAGSRSPRCTGPTARWPSSSRARVTMPTGLVKSTIHASGAARRRTRLGDVEHHRHGAQRLGEPAGPGGLLADAAALEREATRRRRAPAARRPAAAAARRRRRRRPRRGPR